MRRALLVILAGLCIAVLAVAADEPAKTGVAVGDTAPDFMLFGVDYTYHYLGRYDDAAAIVVVFTTNHCPYAVDYEQPLIDLAKEYGPKGVQFIAINPNPADMMAADGFPQMQKRAEKLELPYPYVYDETQNVAKAYGATVTPHVFVLDPELKVRYIGAVDNRHKEPFYLADALEDILAGNEVREDTSLAFGCTIKYRPEPSPEDE